MKALSIRHPWAWLIINGYKDIENRTWATPLRGRIYVHAGKNVDRTVPPFNGKTPPQIEGWRDIPPIGLYTLGCIVGEVDIVDCVNRSDSPWFQGPFGFVLANAKAYNKPIPYKGQLRFFDVSIE